jgi:hypothetical protein
MYKEEKKKSRSAFFFFSSSFLPHSSEFLGSIFIKNSCRLVYALRSLRLRRSFERGGNVKVQRRGCGA